MSDILLRADNSTYNHLDKTCLDHRAVLQQCPVVPGTNYYICSQATAGNLILLVEILCWVLWISQVPSSGFRSMFLEHIFCPTYAFTHSHQWPFLQEATDNLGWHSVVLFLLFLMFHYQMQRKNLFFLYSSITQFRVFPRLLLHRFMKSSMIQY